MARYEVDVDPYRGIFASSDSSSSSTNTSNPWACCAQALAAQPLAVTDDDNNEESAKTGIIAKRCLCCPSLSSWYQQESHDMELFLKNPAKQTSETKTSKNKEYDAEETSSVDADLVVSGLKHTTSSTINQSSLVYARRRTTNGPLSFETYTTYVYLKMNT
eukprot:480273-Ditylum_brightwellii.AAC.1